MKRVQNTTNRTRVFNTVKCGPKQFAELPDGVAATWVERYGFVYVDEPEEKPKRTRKASAEDRV